VASFVAANNLVTDGDLLLAGVSGGIDSVAMALLLAEILPGMGGRMEIIHFNHHLRGGESDGDEAFVAELAARLGVRLTTGSPGGAPHRGESLQEWARRERLAFFRAERERLGGASIALAHTLDDQAETVLMRLLFAGGPGALSGIRPRGPHRIVHPLLETRKAELGRFLERLGVPFRTDSSNRKRTYLRNRIRHDLMPVVTRISPSFHRRLAAVCRIMQDEERFVDDLARESSPITCLASGEAMIDADALRALPVALQRRAMLQAGRAAGVRQKDFRLAHIEALRGLLTAPSGSSLHLPAMRAVRRRREILLAAAGAPKLPALVDQLLAVPGDTRIEALGIDVRIVESPLPTEDLLRRCGPDQAFIDPAGIQGSLRVRTVRPGDRFRPLGSGGSRSLKRFLIDARVDRERKGRIPVFWDDEKIVWVGGYRIDERVKLTAGTNRALRISLATRTE
jgi:tRNA(Ile)-lysidine synthase